MHRASRPEVDGHIPAAGAAVQDIGPPAAAEQIGSRATREVVIARSAVQDHALDVLERAALAVHRGCRARRGVEGEGEVGAAVPEIEVGRVEAAAAIKVSQFAGAADKEPIITRAGDDVQGLDVAVGQQLAAHGILDRSRTRPVAEQRVEEGRKRVGVDHDVVGGRRPVGVERVGPAPAIHGGDPVAKRQVEGLVARPPHKAGRGSAEVHRLVCELQVLDAGKRIGPVR